MTDARQVPRNRSRRHHKDALRDYKTEIRALLDEEKDRACARCGVHYPICCMQFDHLPGTRKQFNLSEARSGLIPRVEVLQELKKCEVVCANCHLIREEERRRAQLTPA